MRPLGPRLIARECVRCNYSASRSLLIGGRARRCADTSGPRTHAGDAPPHIGFKLEGRRGRFWVGKTRGEPG